MNEPTDRHSCRMKAPPAKAAAVVPLADLVALARLGERMRKHQIACERLRAAGVFISDKHREQRALERQFDQAVAAALERERVALPGMGEGGEGAD